jgi:YfiH family protein
MSGIEILTPDWPAPRGVRAAFTLRNGGVSGPPYGSLNLATHVGDRPEAVAENRRRVRAHLELPAEPSWLEQVHGSHVTDLDATGPICASDAAITRHSGRVCAVQVADCMPVLFAARDGSAVASAHAGWRGLAAGVLEATVEKLAIGPSKLLAWLGPAISAGHFEVGDEVRAAFNFEPPSAFVSNARGRWQCDLYAVATRRLRALGLEAIYGGAECTYVDPARFFSFRRDGRCGRMAALIWLAPPGN